MLYWAVLATIILMVKPVILVSAQFMSYFRYFVPFHVTRLINGNACTTQRLFAIDIATLGYPIFRFGILFSVTFMPFVANS